jgi:hypothetical protein
MRVLIAGLHRRLAEAGHFWADLFRTLIREGGRGLRRTFCYSINPKVKKAVGGMGDEDGELAGTRTPRNSEKRPAAYCQ